MARCLFGGILVLGLAACGRAGLVAHATPSATSPHATLQGTRVPVVAAQRTLDANSQFSMAMLQSISSRTARAGDSFSATVMGDVRDDAGRIVLPATSLVSGTIAEVSSASGRDGTGTLTLTVNGVTIRGKHYPMTARIESLATDCTIVGQVLTRNTQGTVIATALGVATGEAYAVTTGESDVRLPEGTRVIVTVSVPLTISGWRR